MSQDPAEIRRQIEKTRERLGETADAIRYKMDIPARMRERVGGVASTTMEDPLRLAAGASLAGLVAGLVIPMLPIERQMWPKLRRTLIGTMGWLNPVEALRRIWQG